MTQTDSNEEILQHQLDQLQHIDRQTRQRIQAAITVPSNTADEAVRALLASLGEATRRPSIHDIKGSLFNSRERSEIDLAVLYESDFGHGTAGHNRLMLIAKLWRLVESMRDDLPDVIQGFREVGQS